MPEYTFDIVDVATFRVAAPDYPTARRAAKGVMEFNVHALYSIRETIAGILGIDTDAPHASDSGLDEDDYGDEGHPDYPRDLPRDQLDYPHNQPLEY